MTHLHILLLANTALFVALGLASAVRTGDTKWPFVWGFASILPATLFLAYDGTGALWRRLMIVLLVAIYVARMLYTLLAWFGATGASKLKDTTPRAVLVILPLVLVPIFSLVYPLPFFVAMDRVGPFALVDAATLLLYSLGTWFHFGADYQKWRFKQDAANKGVLLRRGFWGMSRHPNYFGDFLIYLSFAVVGMWLWGFISPLANLLQYFADAIPKNERQSHKRYGETWESYVSETPIFFPYGRPSKDTKEP